MLSASYCVLPHRFIPPVPDLGIILAAIYTCDANGGFYFTGQKLISSHL